MAKIGEIRQVQMVFNGFDYVAPGYIKTIRVNIDE